MIINVANLNAQGIGKYHDIEKMAGEFKTHRIVWLKACGTNLIWTPARMVAQSAVLIYELAESIYQLILVCWLHDQATANQFGRQVWNTFVASPIKIVTAPTSIISEVFYQKICLKVDYNYYLESASSPPDSSNIEEIPVSVTPPDHTPVSWIESEETSVSEPVEKERELDPSPSPQGGLSPTVERKKAFLTLSQKETERLENPFKYESKLTIPQLPEMTQRKRSTLGRLLTKTKSLLVKNQKIDFSDLSGLHRNDIHFYIYFMDTLTLFLKKEVCSNNKMIDNSFFRKPAQKTVIEPVFSIYLRTGEISYDPKNPHLDTLGGVFKRLMKEMPESLRKPLRDGISSLFNEFQSDEVEVESLKEKIQKLEPSTKIFLESLSSLLYGAYVYSDQYFNPNKAELERMQIMLKGVIPVAAEPIPDLILEASILEGFNNNLAKIVQLHNILFIHK